MPIFSGYTDIVLGMGEILGLAPAGKLPPAVFFCQRQGAVGPVAYQPFCSGSGIMCISHWAATARALPAGCPTLLLTFLVSGLWHGANWTFLVWGGLHGLCQVAEDHMPAPLRKRKSRRCASWACR